MFMVLFFVGLMLVSLAQMMRNRRLGKSINQWGEFWPSKDSLTPTEYWLHRVGFFAAGAGIVLTVVTLGALLIAYRQ